MKSKKIGVSILTIILGLICGLGFVSMPKQKIEASAVTEPTVYTQYMLEGGVPIKKEGLTTSAGKLFVNGKEITSQEELSFVLTEQNIQLRAEANIGYELKGWYVTYKDKTDDVQGTNNGYVAIGDYFYLLYTYTTDEAWKTDKELIYTYNTENEKYTLNTDEEYNSNKNYFIRTDSTSICDDNIVVNKYSSSNKIATMSIAEMQDSLIIAPVFDYQYYTVTYKGFYNNEIIENPGYPGFKFGDVVTINKDIAAGVNIDATSLVSSQITLKEDEGGELIIGEYKFSQDANLRTTKVEAKFEMNVYKDVVIELRYDRLYRVDLELYLEDTKLTTGIEYNEILSCVSVAEDKAYSKIDNSVTKYFVKNGADFAIACTENYKNAEGYTYYEFESLDGSTGRNLNLNSISTDRAIQIKYTHKKYNVQFVGVEYNKTDKTVVVNEDLIVADNIQLTRIDSPILLNNLLLETGKDWATLNVGYDYRGFVKFESGKTEYIDADKITSYTLSSTQPKDVVIYVLYEKISYTLNLTGLTDVSLTDTNVDPVVTYYPIKSATINGAKKEGEAISFDGFKIGDTVTLSLELNIGFGVSSVAEMTKQGDAQTYTLTLDKTFLTGKEKTINLHITAETLKYTLVYRIKEDADLNTMATLSVDGLGKNADGENVIVTNEDRINDAENFIDDGYYHIKVTNLTYYQNVVLKSMANSTGNTDEYFVYRYFTYDGSTSISGVTGDKATPETQTLPLVINGDATVTVVYTQPKTLLQIVLESAPADAGISFVVKQGDVTDELEVEDGFYTIQKGSNNVNITINGLDANPKLYGYKFIDIKLYTQSDSERTEVLGNDSQNTSSYSFTPNSAGTNDMFVVVIKIVKIEYEFNLTANLAGFNTESGSSNTLTKILTVDKAEIEFGKVVGYYVNIIQIKKGEQWIDYSSKMAQSNISRSGYIINGRDYFKVYYYNFADNFKNIIEEYGVTDGGKIKVNIFMSFIKYEYEVLVNYVKYNDDAIDNSDVNMVYPTIRLGYKFTDDTSKESLYANYESLSGGIKFKGIPYGADVTLEVVKGVSIGFEMKGWYGLDGITNKESLTAEEKLLKFVKEGVVNDFGVNYRVDFEKYTINLSPSISGAGSPKINGSESAKVKMGDSIKIEPNASLSNGYLFNQFKYKANKLVTYEFVDAEQFALDWNTLYIKDKDGYLYKNISTVKNEDYEYFTIVGEDTEANVQEYEEIFNIAKYYTSTNIIIFELVYVPVEMNIENKSLKIEGLDLSKFDLDENDIASYILFVNGEEIKENSEDYKVTINDSIKIIVQINKSAQGHKEYDLTRGLVLNEYALESGWNDNLSSNDKGNGKYEIAFQVNKILKPEFAQAGKITINYGYLLKGTQQITVTTNMAGSSDFVNNTLLKINGIKESSSIGAEGVVEKVNQENPFLQDVNISLDLQDYSSYFVVHSVTVYKDFNGTGEKLEVNRILSDDLAENWIVDNGALVSLTVLDFGVIVQFNVQPRIYVEGEEITTQLEKWITRDYAFEVVNGEIVGKQQIIELGTNKGIEGYGIIYLAVEIWQDGVKLPNGAINVGEYDIELVFKGGLTDEQMKNCWKSYITDLPCALKLEINPVVVSVTYDKSSTQQFEQEYNSKSDYNLGLKNNGTKLISDDGNIVLAGKYGNNLTFDLGLLNVELSKAKAEIVTGNKVEGLRSQRNVTGNYAHILITDLELKNNKNFELSFEEYDYFITLTDTEKRQGVLVQNVVKINPHVIYIENLEVYDKVEEIFDINKKAVADFGLAEGKSEYSIMHIFGVDQVSLLPGELKVYFTNAPATANTNLVDILDGGVGADKCIVIDARTALDGRDKANYVVGDLRNGLLNYKDLKTIYPYQITSVVKGVGNVTLTNEIGKTNHKKANLIPVGAKVSLIAERIEPNSVGYREIEEKISGYISRRNTFACGYKLTLLDNNGIEVKISNELKLTIPNEEDLKNIVSIAGGRSRNIQYTFDAAGNIVIDLSQIEEDISTFCLIQNRALLKAWQIVLIVVLSLVVAAGIGVAVFFIVRRRRKKNEKYDVI